MNEKEIKQLEDYFSSLEKEVIVKYPSPHDNKKPQYLLLSKGENGRIRGQILGPYGATVMLLEDIAKEGFEIANFKGIEEVLKKKSKK